MSVLTSSQARIYSRLGQRGSIFGCSVLEHAKSNNNLVVLTADLASLSGLDRFTKTFPEKFLNIGIAEQNMIGIAAGLSSEGYLPVVTTYATFITMRSCEQIRHYLGYMGLKVIVIGSGAGLIQAYSGNTHYTIEDLSIMRAIPNIAVISPADAGEAVKAFEAALTYKQSVYIRLTGGLNCPIVYKDDYQYFIGQASTVREGEDVVVFATGTMVSSAIKVATDLSESGISTKVVDMHTIKPIDVSAIQKCKKLKLFVSIEEHNIIGGLGSAISEVMSSETGYPPLLRLGIDDTFNLAGDYNDLLSQNMLLPYQIKASILERFSKL